MENTDEEPDYEAFRRELEELRKKTLGRLNASPNQQVQVESEPLEELIKRTLNEGEGVVEMAIMQYWVDEDEFFVGYCEDGLGKRMIITRDGKEKYLTQLRYREIDEEQYAKVDYEKWVQKFIEKGNLRVVNELSRTFAEVNDKTNTLFTFPTTLDPPEHLVYYYAGDGKDFPVDFDKLEGNYAGLLSAGKKFSLDELDEEDQETISDEFEQDTIFEMLYEVHCAKECYKRTYWNEARNKVFKEERKRNLILRRQREAKQHAISDATDGRVRLEYTSDGREIYRHKSGRFVKKENLQKYVDEAVVRGQRKKELRFQ